MCCDIIRLWFLVPTGTTATNHLATIRPGRRAARKLRKPPSAAPG